VGDAAPLPGGDGPPGRERLSGHVEVDEAYVGGVEDKVHGRETDTKAIVAIAVEIENPKGVRADPLGHVPDVTKESLLPFIDGAVEPGSTVHTDGWQAYLTLGNRGYEHEANGDASAERRRHVVIARRSPRRQPAAALGCWAPTRARSHASTSMPTSTSSPSASTAAAPVAAACCSTGLLEQAILAEPITYRSLIANPSPTGRRPSLASQPGRVATPAAVHRPWRQSPANPGLPESNR